MSEPRQIAPIVFMTGVNQAPEVTTEKTDPERSFRDYLRRETPQPVFEPDDSRLAFREFVKGRKEQTPTEQPVAEESVARVVALHPSVSSSYPDSDIPEV